MSAEEKASIFLYKFFISYHQTVLVYPTLPPIKRQSQAYKEKELHFTPVLTRLTAQTPGYYGCLHVLAEQDKVFGRGETLFTQWQFR